ncbi:MAG: hypothetical protein ABJB01_09175 [Rudaea sp.]
MDLIQRFRTLCAVLGILACAAASAGTPIAVQILGGSTANFSSTGVGVPITQTLTLNFNANGTTAEGASLSALTFGGANAADFAIVGGTCAAGTTVLSSTATSCTVIVRFTPSTAATESGQLDGSCTTIGLIGGFTLSCNGVSGELFSLAGAVIAAVVSLPMLDPKILTLLCALLLGIGVYFASRKKA